ncbi:Retrovirus-related Pol polyprotein from transposon TNT 1-94-like protein [Drosera capensis]
MVLAFEENEVQLLSILPHQQGERIPSSPSENTTRYRLCQLDQEIYGMHSWSRTTFHDLLETLEPIAADLAAEKELRKSTFDNFGETLRNLAARVIDQMKQNRSVNLHKQRIYTSNFRKFKGQQSVALHKLNKTMQTTKQQIDEHMQINDIKFGLLETKLQVIQKNTSTLNSNKKGEKPSEEDQQRSKPTDEQQQRTPSKTQREKPSEAKRKSSEEQGKETKRTKHHREESYEERGGHFRRDSEDKHRKRSRESEEERRYKHSKGKEHQKARSQVGSCSLGQMPVSRRLQMCEDRENHHMKKIQRSLDKQLVLVAKGFTQREGQDYNETFSPLTKKDSLRIILALVVHLGIELHQMNVKTAFQNRDLYKEVYINQHEGCVEQGKQKLKSINGLKQASKQRYLKFNHIIVLFGLCESPHDKCIYVKVNGSKSIEIDLVDY